MGFKKFINSLKNFGDTISSAADSVFDEVDKASEKADDAADTFLGRVKRGLILLESDKEETDETD